MLRETGRFGPVSRAEFNSVPEMRPADPFSRPDDRCGY
ncbi:hypothetical protein BURMUCF1_0453 [Burkholderia multivorans ATCC BAA-247]|uniref:Uncharacterized protein n=1 Tax=Burkholderia multivorans CGD2 TaxID=513052 RepID=B9BT92_9BURK|nr:hypothetical protein BURMUCGD2_3016 [Burkholderia multivorans CGD2]EEE11236.1 hypothetical protein BURMUCGD2M_3101 [Burkholderia multivorans CGD2M]EJO62961.1 hypothetical protein BURMUCF1_0453 [Burkholderia multivorans ATCC BAA-247]